MNSWDIQGVVFDVDGVLFDTERLGRLSWQAVGRELGYPHAADHYLEFVGLNRTDAEAKMLSLFGPGFPCDYFMRMCSSCTQSFIERDGVPLKPGVRELLTFLRQRSVPTALATSSGRKRTARRLELAGLTAFFSAFISQPAPVNNRTPGKGSESSALRDTFTPSGDALTCFSRFLTGSTLSSRSFSSSDSAVAFILPLSGSHRLPRKADTYAA